MKSNYKLPSDTWARQEDGPQQTQYRFSWGRSSFRSWRQVELRLKIPVQFWQRRWWSASLARHWVSGPSVGTSSKRNRSVNPESTSHKKRSQQICPTGRSLKWIYLLIKSFEPQKKTLSTMDIIMYEGFWEALWTKILEFLEPNRANQQ